MCKTAPSKFIQHARNPDRNVEIGGKTLVTAPVYGPPFVRDRQGGRRYATISDFQKFVKPANDKENLYKSLNDEEIKNKINLLKSSYSKSNNNISIDDQIEAISIVREVSFRTIGLRHFDSQIIGGICLYNGLIAEMKTGEGKTLVSTIPAFLNFICGLTTHLVTVNDYLAKRDSEWMDPIYKFLGMKNSYIQNNMSIEEKINSYNSDIVYGNNNEFCFDFLRDNLRSIETPKVQTSHHRAIIDEADSVLIDEARSPLGISGEVKTPIQLFKICYQLTENLNEKDVEISEERKNVVQLAKSYGYKIKPISPAYVDLTMKCTIGAKANGDPDYSTARTIDKGLQTSATTNPEIIFETRPLHLRLVNIIGNDQNISFGLKDHNFNTSFEKNFFSHEYRFLFRIFCWNY